MVMTPSRELAQQIFTVARQLVDAPSDVELLVGSPRERAPAAPLLIGIPRVLDERLGARGALATLHTLVADEPEALFRPLPRFASQRQRELRTRHPKAGTRLLDRIALSCAPRPQLICVSATLNAALRNFLRSRGWAREAEAAAAGEGDAAARGEEADEDAAADAMRVPAHIRHFVVSAEDEEKVAALVALLRAKGQPRALVVANEHVALDPVVAALRAEGLRAAALHRVLHNQADTSELQHAFAKGAIQVVVCSEAVARGLDFPFVSLVAVMNVPASAASYLHIAGRTGRMGAPGEVFAVLSSDEQQRFDSQLNRLAVWAAPWEPPAAQVAAAAVAEAAKAARARRVRPRAAAITQEPGAREAAAAEARAFWK
jgi:superfamily II DNA/RNA helicase